MKAVPELRRIVKKVRPDIIHLHSSKAGVLGRIAFWGKKTPLFYTPHGYSFLMENYSPVKRNLFKAIETFFAKSRCTTISCSPGEHQETLKMTKRAAYVNNSINTDQLGKILSLVRPEAHAFTVFTIGRICFQKNPELFNRIARAMPDVRFLWIGDGELRSSLTAENIEITGWLDREEVLKRAVSSDVFVLTSLWEGMPISLLEAMYMRKLCVVSDVIGNRDVIQSGRNGFVCGSVEEFTKAIRTSPAEPLTEAAFADIGQKYNTKVMAEAYIRIYETAAGE